MKRLIILSMMSFCLFSQAELKAQFKLQLVQIKCITPEESGGDETYIKVNGNRVWKKNMKKNTSRSLLAVPPISFNCPISIRIYDEDLYSDDYCGRYIVNVTSSDYNDLGRNKLQEFTGIGQDCKYEITYKILLDN